MIYIAIIGLITGTLIGLVGIGGVLLTPLLSYFLGIDLHLAMASSSMSFLFTGAVGTASYARTRSISWELVLWLSIGIIPAAILGARVNTLLSTNILLFLIAILIALSGINALKVRPSKISTQIKIGKKAIILIGLIVGFGSALTGTGGPVLLIPILVSLDYHVLATIGASQAIQLPIALFATIGFVTFGIIDFQLGITLGIFQAIGVLVGARIAHNLTVVRLRQLVAISLIAVGFLLIGRTFI